MNREKLMQIAENIMLEEGVRFNEIEDVFYNHDLEQFRKNNEFLSDSYFSTEGLVVRYTNDFRFNNDYYYDENNNVHINPNRVNKYFYCINSMRLMMYLLERI